MRARRLPVVDEFVEGDEAVIFVNGQVVALSALATTALFAVGTEWTEAQVVADALVRKFGPPPAGADPMSSSRATLEALVRLEIVELGR